MLIFLIFLILSESYYCSSSVISLKVNHTNAVPVIDAGDGVHVSSGASTNVVAEDEGAGDKLS